MPNLHELCPICGERVQVGPFNCVCGAADDGVSPTVKCSKCWAWGHSRCSIVKSFLCKNCTPDRNLPGHVWNGGDGHNFNPRSVSVEIRSLEEFVAVKEFLDTLGRNVSGRPQQKSAPSAAAAAAFPPDYFDPVSLSQLGLAGMPGMPPSHTHYSPEPAPYPNGRELH
ncbi:hypothetical protein ARMSODRAFT_952315 [Armillaria solidipes]|uniref:Zinc finger PHD-type domain-containing protein n=1 Tax=Armillaria solidipes TaxID=1076256 RepID=A0A2H3C940_9AGAR|nr:hypothetical protein ARMSODRAFT_952315 [Armillaria solidipes]